MVADWYRRWVGTEFEGAGLPALYHHYIGHDNNRDWYAFTQRETQLTVEHAHNAWRPHIVHDVHQMGGAGARIFLPPYTDPVEPNVDPLIIAAVNQLGSYMAAEMLAEGKTGVVTNAIFDIYTPARAYQHYHAGARILSETASARMATPVEVAPGELRSGRGYTVDQRSWNFPAPWPGGTWGLPQIVDYMESAAMSLLVNAAANRPYWVENAYRINQRAVRKWDSWPEAWVIPGRAGERHRHRGRAPDPAPGGRGGADGAERLHRGRAQLPGRQLGGADAPAVRRVRADHAGAAAVPADGGLPGRAADAAVRRHRAHAAAADGDRGGGGAGAGFAWRSPPRLRLHRIRYTAPPALSGRRAPRIGVYKGWAETMPTGWTRWVLDQHGIRYDTLHNADIRRGDLNRRYDVILFQDQSARQIMEGNREGSMPPGFTGGIGEEGLVALRNFVERGGRIVAVESATDLFTDAFDLRLRNLVRDVPPQDFFIPGSILSLRLEPSSPVGGGCSRRERRLVLAQQPRLAGG